MRSTAGPRRLPSPGLLGAARTLAIDAVTAEVVSAFGKAGIPCILLKGPSIARWLYPDGGRSYSDTDLLVRGSDYAPAGALLVSMGFQDQFAGFSAFERRLFESAATAYVRPRHVGGRGGAAQAAARTVGGNIDLHRNLYGLAAPDEELWDALSAGTTTLPIAGVDVRVLDRTGVALHIVVHAMQTGFRSHTGEDLRRVIGAMTPPEWEAVAALAARLGIADVLGHGLRREEAGAEVADGLGLPDLAVADSPYRWLLLGGPRGAGSLLALREAPTWRARAHAIRWMLLPSPAKSRYVAGVPDQGGRTLVLAYARWWRDLARAALPAAQFARRRAVYPRNG